MVKGRISASICCDRDCTEKYFSFTIPCRISELVRKELDAKRGAYDTVQSSLKSSIASRGINRRKYRKILQLVWSGVAISRIIQRHAIVDEIDAASTAEPDGIPEYRIPGTSRGVY